MTKYWYTVVTVAQNGQKKTFTTTSKTEDVETYPVISAMGQIMTMPSITACRIDFFAEISESEYKLSKESGNFGILM